jgi:hypothetical protein
LVNTPDSAKEVLSMSNKLDSDIYSFLDNNFSENEFGDFHNLKTIGDYYNTYFSPVKCLLVNRVSLRESSNKNASTSGSSNEEEGKEQTSQNKESNKKEFENKGEQIVLKNNKAQMHSRLPMHLLTLYHHSIQNHIYIQTPFDHFCERPRFSYNVE